MANFIGMVFATLKEEGIDTKGMSTDEAVAKFKELQKSSGGKEGETEGTPAEQRKVNDSRLAQILEERGQGEDIDFAKDTDYFGYGSLENLEKAHKSGYKNEDGGENNSQEDVVDETNQEQIDYENVEYPKGTSKEYTKIVNQKYEKSLPILEEAGIKESDFKTSANEYGGMDSNVAEIMNKYVFEPFREKYPKGNNEAWEKEYQPLYDAIDNVADKKYNDFYIKNKNNLIL